MFCPQTTLPQHSPVPPKYHAKPWSTSTPPTSPSSAARCSRAQDLPRRPAEAKRSVTKQEKALTNTHTVPFNKYKVFFGFVKSYITIYIFGHSPHEFPAWNALQMLVLFPVTAYRWAKLKWLVFFTEFCWVSNLFLAIYCITLHTRPALVPPEHRTTMTHFFFAVAAGPLQAAVVLWECARAAQRPTT